MVVVGCGCGCSCVCGRCRSWLLVVVGCLSDGCCWLWGCCCCRGCCCRFCTVSVDGCGLLSFVVFVFVVDACWSCGCLGLFVIVCCCLRPFDV